MWARMPRSASYLRVKAVQVSTDGGVSWDCSTGGRRMGLPYIKFYLGDFLRDTMHLRGHARNAYAMLLMLQWQNGSLPSDEGELANMLGLDARQWDAISKPVLAFFDKVDGRLMQARVVRDRAAALEKRSKLVQAAKASHAPGSLRNKRKISANAEQKHMPSGVGVITDSPTGTESVEKQESLNACSLDHEFAQIWAIYPRRTHRLEGRMAYHEARKIASFREIVAGIDRLKATSPNPDYVPSLPKWLLGERWNDEALPSKAERETPYQAAIRKAKADIERVYGERDSSFDRSNVIDLKANQTA